MSARKHVRAASDRLAIFSAGACTVRSMPQVPGRAAVLQMTGRYLMPTTQLVSAPLGAWRAASLCGELTWQHRPPVQVKVEWAAACTRLRVQECIALWGIALAAGAAMHCSEEGVSLRLPIVDVCPCGFAQAGKWVSQRWPTSHDSPSVHLTWGCRTSINVAVHLPITCSLPASSSAAPSEAAGWSSLLRLLRDSWRLSVPGGPGGTRLGPGSRIPVLLFLLSGFAAGLASCSTATCCEDQRRQLQPCACQILAAMLHQI